MKKALKVVVVLAVLVVLLIAGLVFFLFQNLDKIVQRGTEKGLTYVLEVPVTVGGASVDVGNGSIELREINIPNPEGYKSDHALSYGLIRVQADIQSFRTDKPVINLIRISNSDIVMESKGKSTNIQDLMASAQRLASGERTDAPEEEEEAGKQMVIEKLVIDGSTVSVRVPLLEKTYSVKLPDVEKENIGGGEGEQVSPAEAMTEMLAILLEQIKQAGAGILPGDLLGGIGDSLKGLSGDLQKQLGDLTSGATGSAESVLGGVKGGAEGAGKTAESLATDTAKTAEDAVGGIKTGIGGLLGKKKDE